MANFYRESALNFACNAGKEICAATYASLEEGQQIAHTAFEALAVTEKMTSDAFSLDRRLKIGFASVFVIAAVMAVIYFLFAHSAQTETKQANKIILGLEGGLVRQQDLVAEVRKLRAAQVVSGSSARRQG